MKRLYLILIMVFGLSGIALATPLRMDYSVSDLGGGIYDYEFALVLDNNDSSWSAGQGWGWIIFGDAPFPNQKIESLLRVGCPIHCPVICHSLFGGGEIFEHEAVPPKNVETCTIGEKNWHKVAADGLLMSDLLNVLLDLLPFQPKNGETDDQARVSLY